MKRFFPGFVIWTVVTSIIWRMGDFPAVPAAEPVPMTTPIVWTKLPSLPDHEGFAGPFAGVSQGALIVAGGANFPDKRPWEGGTKRWYDSTFVLDRPDGKWRTGSPLPRASAYGVSLTLPDGIVCIGGGDSREHFADVFLLTWNGRTLVTSPLPSLPRPCAFLSGAALGQSVLVAGGIETPDATQALSTCWRLDLSKQPAGWEELEHCPGAGRILATAGAQDGSFFLFSGAALKAGPDGKPVRQWLRDAWRYTPGSGWSPLADLPRVAVAAPSPAIALAPSKLLILGGDDGRQVDSPPTQHVGFPRSVLVYDTLRNTFTEVGELPFSLVTTPATLWDGRVVVPGGEVRPGIRSTEVWLGEINSR